MYNGLPERITKEIKALAPESMEEEVKVIASPENNSLSGLEDPSFHLSTPLNQCGSLTLNMESDATIVQRKCYLFISV